MVDEYVLELRGYCPICEQETWFRAKQAWYRDFLECATCPGGSIPRERALALVLDEVSPDWRRLVIHESSPAPRGISVKLQRECRAYTATHYHPGAGRGVMVDQIRNEDLHDLTFADRSFDVFVSLDVLEHLPDPKIAVQEVSRTLRTGGLFISTFPIMKHRTAPLTPRALFHRDGSVTHLSPPEIHGNPISAEGSLVTVEYGYDIHLSLAEWGGFDVRVYRFADQRHGILGEFTEVITGRKRNSATVRA